MMQVVPRLPLTVFAIQCAILAGGLAWAGRLHPERADDTPSYEQFSFASLRDCLSQSRTLGYPIYLRITRLAGESMWLAPAGHLALHALAVFVFWRGLRGLSWAPWTSMFVASSLLYSNPLLRTVGMLTPDCLASSCSIAAVGCLLLIVSWPHVRILWALMLINVLMAYQLRPAYLLLTLLLPVLGFALHWWIVREASRRERWRLLRRLAAVCLVPLIAFCGIRWLVMGDFGLVAFGGNNLAGVVSGFLTNDDTQKLPERVQPLARTIVMLRQELAETDQRIPSEPTLSYMVIENQFDAATWVVCVPAARKQVGDGWPEVNKSLTEYSIAAIRLKPKFYFVWLVKASIRGVYMILSEIIMNPVYLLLMGLLAVAQAWWAGAIRNVGWLTKLAEIQPTRCNDFFWQIHSLWLIALGFASAKLLLVIITTPALGRFMDPAGVFLPLILVRLLVDRIEWIWEFRRQRSVAEMPHQ